jgi:aspartyl/glutamyl-tRNA(Asn/Gln) amidotransferase C subunit
MAQITKAEVLKLAQLSNITIRDDEIDGMVTSIDDVLNYAARVQKIAADVVYQSPKQTNIMREDVVISTDPAPILAQAPEVEQNYFVVPMILESSEKL